MAFFRERRKSLQITVTPKKSFCRSLVKTADTKTKGEKIMNTLQANEYLLKYSTKQIRKNKNNNEKLQEFRRIKKIATDNIYNNNNLRQNSIWKTLLGII